jgi:hypothetical protein
LRVEVNHTLGMVESLVGLAGVAGSVGQATKAVRLFGAVDGLCQVTGYTMDPDDRVEYNRNLDLARGQLDEAAFDSAWAEGQALTLEQAVQEALAPMSEAVSVGNHRTESSGPGLSDPLLSPQSSVLSPPLSRAEFAAATQDLLRNFARPYMLQDNPLLRSGLVVQRSGLGANASHRTAALQALVKEVLETIKGSPQDVKLYRAVYHTYIQPAPTQEQASELLDIPYSTFRRHLKAGISRVTEVLWQWEMQALDG